MQSVVEFRKNEGAVAAYAKVISEPAFIDGVNALRETFCSSLSPFNIRNPGLAPDHVAAFLLGLSCGRHEMLDAVLHLHEVAVDVEPVKETYSTKSEV